MANTYSQISIHAVIVVKHRNNLITKDWRNELHAYISGILNEIGCTPLAVGGWQDHVHIFFGLPVTSNIADIMRVVKANSSKWINMKKFISVKFEWQTGYSAFSYAKSQRDVVIKYITNQEQHHKTKTFKQEYLQMLQDFGVQHDEKYLFDFLD